MAYWNSPRSSRYEERWPAYVPVAERRRLAEKEMEKLRKKGIPISPIKLEGKKIATTFWGKAWCDNLESYRDYENRLERGRTYVRNGSVMDLQIALREVTAMVSGSSIYKVKVTIGEVGKAHWKSICADCSGGIDSLVELLQGRFSKGVMERICRLGSGLFPEPADIDFSCSCPDYASMCKHVAAVLYGVGARLDAQPELLFRLRAVNEKDLVADIGKVLPMAKDAPAGGKVLEADDMAALFGLDMGGGGDEMAVAEVAQAPKVKKAPATGKRAAAVAKTAVRESRTARQPVRSAGSVEPGSGPKATPVRNGRRKSAAAPKESKAQIPEPRPIERRKSDGPVQAGRTQVPARKSTKATVKAKVKSIS